MSEIMTWPAAWYRVASGSFTLQSSNLRSQSPWTKRVSVSGPIAQLFMVKVTLSTQEFDNWASMEGFFAECAGGVNIIRMCDFSRRQPQWNKEFDGVSTSWSDGTYWTDGTGWLTGKLPETVYVGEAATKGATSVIVSGLEDFASTGRVLRRGDDVEFRRGGTYDETPSLHRVIRDMPTDANGEGRLEFRPSLRKAVAAGDQITLIDPMGNFRLIDDNQAVVERTPPNFGDLGFELIEALI